MIEIRYIWHDGFFVNTDTCAMVFDYWCEEKDVLATQVSRAGGETRNERSFKKGRDAEIPSVLRPLDRSKPLYVFVSHSHKDHFNPDIFYWASEFADVRYLVSKDVFRRMRHVISETSVYNGPRVDAESVIVLTPGDSYEDDRLSVRAFASTDIGNSYSVEVGDCRFFHAGDLNAWIWKDESTEQEVKKALGDYKAILRDIKNTGITSFDYVFFPVDSRIGTDYFEGARIFVREFGVRHFFPMHFGLGDETERARRRSDALRFDLYMNQCYGEYIWLGDPRGVFISGSKDH